MVDTLLAAGFCSDKLAPELLPTLCYALGVLSGLAIFPYVMAHAGLGFKTLKKSKTPKKTLWQKTFGEARNASAAAVLNSTTSYQKIESAEIEIPVIAEDVLVYQAGELGASYPDVTRLFYSAEALQDPEYLETVTRSPLQVQTHEKNTSEFNRGVDGWPLSAWWDEAERRVKVRGIVHGEDNVAYVKENRNKPNFGTSAYISFLEIDRTPGTAPNGKPYDAIVRKAVNNHIAILPNVRDPKNVILAMNAVKEEPDMQDGQNALDLKDEGSLKARNAQNADPSDNWRSQAEAEFGRGLSVRQYEEKTLSAGSSSLRALYRDLVQRKENQALRVADGRLKNAKNNQEKTNEAVAAAKRSGINAIKNEQETKRMPIDKEDFKEAMMAYQEDGKKEEELVNKIKNAVLNELKPSDDKPADKPAENADEEKPVEEKKDEAANALPSESMVKDFSDALGITFKTTPSLKELALVAGVNGAGAPAELIAALNAKRETLRKPAAASAQNSGGAPVSIDDLIKKM